MNSTIVVIVVKHSLKYWFMKSTDTDALHENRHYADTRFVRISFWPRLQNVKYL